LICLLTGLARTNSQNEYNASWSTRQKILQLLPGLMGTLVFDFRLRAIFPRGDMFIAYLWRYLRFALVGSWVTTEICPDHTFYFFRHRMQNKVLRICNYERYKAEPGTKKYLTQRRRLSESTGIVMHLGSISGQCSYPLI